MIGMMRNLAHSKGGHELGAAINKGMDDLANVMHFGQAMPFSSASVQSLGNLSPSHTPTVITPQPAQRQIHMER